MNEPPAQLIDDLRLLQAPTPLIVWLLLLLGLLLLLALVVFVRRRFRAKSRHLTNPGLVGTAHEDALGELEAARKLIASESSKPYGIEVSRIVRRYIEVRFGLLAPRRSTEEFLIEAQASSRLERHYRALLAKFLGACDLFKFGRTHAEPTELSILHDAAVKFVTETRIVPMANATKEMA